MTLQEIAELLPFRYLKNQTISVQYLDLGDSFAMMVSEGDHVNVVLHSDILLEGDSRLLQGLYVAMESNLIEYPFALKKEDFQRILAFWSLSEIVLRLLATKIIFGHGLPSGAVLDTDLDFKGWKGLMLLQAVNMNFMATKNPGIFHKATKETEAVLFSKN